MRSRVSNDCPVQKRLSSAGAVTLMKFSSCAGRWSGMAWTSGCCEDGGGASESGGKKGHQGAAGAGNMNLAQASTWADERQEVPDDRW